MSRIAGTTATLNMTTNIDVNASVFGQPHASSQILPPSNSQTPPAQDWHSTTIPRDTNERSQSDDEQSGIKNGNEAGVNRNNQTDIEQSGVRSGNEAVENKNNQTDDEQPGVTNNQETSENKPVSQITVIEKQGD